MEARRHDLQGPSRRLQPAAVPDRPGRRKSPRKEFFYFSDDGDLIAPALRQLEVRVLPNSGPRDDGDLGANRSSNCAFRCSSTCARIPTSGPTSRRTPITTGCSTMRFVLVPAQADRRQVPRDLQGIPAEPEGRQLQPGRRCWSSCSKARAASNAYADRNARLDPPGRTRRKAGAAQRVTQHRIRKEPQP